MPKSPSKIFIPAILGALLVAAFWAFPYFWYNRTPPGNFVWLVESTNVPPFTFQSTPISKVEEWMIQGDKVVSAQFTNKNDTILAFSAKRFSNDPNEKGLFAHTPDRCWTQAGWRHDLVQPETIQVSAGGIQLNMERRVFIWKSGQRLLVYFGGLSAGRPLPYRLNHELSVALRQQPGGSYAARSATRAIDKQFWGNLWDAFRERRPMLGPKHFIRIATPIDGSDLAAADKRLQTFLNSWLQPGDFAADVKTRDTQREEKSQREPDGLALNNSAAITK